MADVQKQFEQFHERIRVDYGMADELREKRDLLVGKVRKHLEEKGHSFTVLLQGSYKMKTGAKPIGALEYDMDVGLRFNLKPEDYPAKEVRSWVLEAVEGHTKKVADKGPCIRVVYEAGYHLDFVVYAHVEDEETPGLMLYHLAHKTKGWREADPPGLVKYIDEYRTRYFAGTEDSATKTDQFRRAIRCLRRWNDRRIPIEAEEKPAGLAYVLLAVQRQLTRRSFLDGRSDDRVSLQDFTRRVSQTVGRVTAPKPTPEFEEMFRRLTERQMNEFKSDLAALADSLQFAGETADPVEACEKLREVFGEDFPVPKPERTAKKTAAPAVTISSTSA